MFLKIRKSSEKAFRMNATNINIEALLRRVQDIADLTGTEGKKQKIEPSQEADEFTRKKQLIGQEIRELRNAIQDRDDYANSHEGKNDQVEIIKKGHIIREKIKDLRDKSQEMKDLLNQEEQKLLRKGKSTECLENRRKLCDLIDEHINECDGWLKGNKPSSLVNDPHKRALLKGAQFKDTNPQLIDYVEADNPTETQLEDIEGVSDAMLQIEANEQEINSKLDQLIVGTQIVNQLALQIHDEYQVLMTMDNDLDNKMDDTKNNLDDANKRIKDLQKKVNAGGNCCIDITLVLIIVACIGYLIWKYVA